MGTGVVIDRFGKQSKQCDIIIYDKQLYPSLLSLSTVHFFPVDLVYATIEVKTTLTSQSAQEALANIASVRKLEIIPDKFIGAELDTKGGWSVMQYNPEPPQGYVFAYNSESQYFQTFKGWFAPKNINELKYAPTLVGCIDQGILYYKDKNGVILTQPGEDGQLKGLMLPLVDIQGQPIVSNSPIDSYPHGGIVYPVKSLRPNFYVPIDQSKVLLYFLLLLQESLSRKRINPSISFLQHYKRADNLYEIN